MKVFWFYIKPIFLIMNINLFAYGLFPMTISQTFSIQFKLGSSMTWKFYQKTILLLALMYELLHYSVGTKKFGRSKVSAIGSKWLSRNSVYLININTIILISKYSLLLFTCCLPSRKSIYVDLLKRKTPPFYLVKNVRG